MSVAVSGALPARLAELTDSDVRGASGGASSPAAGGRHAGEMDDYLTLALLASGLAAILRQRAGESWQGEKPGLLPGAWRVAFARLWWRLRERDSNALRSDLELLDLCAQPLATSPIDLAISEADNVLLVGQDLSPFAGAGCPAW